MPGVRQARRHVERRLAVAGGLATATPLTDPSFAEVRGLPGFAEIAASMAQ